MNHPYRRDNITGKDFFLGEWKNVFKNGKDDEETKHKASQLPGVIHCRWSHLPTPEKGVKNKLIVWVDVDMVNEFLKAAAKECYPFSLFQKNKGGSFTEKDRRIESGNKTRSRKAKV